MSKKDNGPTQIRLSVNHANNAIEFYLNNSLLKKDVEVIDVEWLPMDSQFSIKVRESGSKEP